MSKTYSNEQWPSIRMAKQDECMISYWRASSTELNTEICTGRSHAPWSQLFWYRSLTRCTDVCQLVVQCCSSRASRSFSWSIDASVFSNCTLQSWNGETETIPGMKPLPILGYFKITTGKKMKMALFSGWKKKQVGGTDGTNKSSSRENKNQHFLHAAQILVQLVCIFEGHSPTHITL